MIVIGHKIKGMFHDCDWSCERCIMIVTGHVRGVS